MEKAWPPLKECVQYEFGLMKAALLKYPWEDDKYAFDFNSYYPPILEELASLRKLLDDLNKNPRTLQEDTRYCPFCRLYPDHSTGLYRIPLDVDILKDPVWDMDPIPCPSHLRKHVWPWGSPTPRLVTPIELDDTKKYINQVRNSRGYDVDCLPHGCLVIPEFWNIEPPGLSKMKDMMKKLLDSKAIVHINSKTDKVYQLEDILKVVWTRIHVFLVTFTAKVKNDDSAACDTFVATINPFDDTVLYECLLKPDCDAPGPDHYPNFIIRPMRLPNITMMWPIAADSLGSNRIRTMTPPSASTAEETSDDRVKRIEKELESILQESGVTLKDLSPLDPSPNCRRDGLNSIQAWHEPPPGAVLEGKGASAAADVA